MKKSSKGIKKERTRIQGLLDKFFDNKKIKSNLMRSMLKYWIADDNRDHHCFRLAEFAVGTNSMACKDKTPANIGSSEGEKMLGTAHIAIGSNGSFGIEKTDPEFNNVAIHCDMVIGQPTVECTKKNGDKFYLIKAGKTIGY